MTDVLPQASLLASFSAGLLSFVSPCVLPLVPSYLMYITGLSLEQLSDPAGRRRLRTTIVVSSLLFIAGFSAMFIAFGASASLLGQILAGYQDVIRKVGAGLMILFGLSLSGIVTPTFLMRESRLRLRSRPAGYVGSFLIGAAFAAGWTPCVGPVLGTVLLYAGTGETMMDGVSLLAFYSLGLGLPLFLTAIGLDRFLAGFRQVRAYGRVASVTSGFLLILFGVLMYRDALPLLTSFFERYGIGAYVDVTGGGV